MAVTKVWSNLYNSWIRVAKKKVLVLIVNPTIHSIQYTF